jgi:hypothetical protein
MLYPPVFERQLDLLGGNCDGNLERGLVTKRRATGGRQFFFGVDIGYSQSDDSHDKYRKI